MKKIFLIIISLFSIFQAHASISVDDVFVDVDKNYKYYREVQELYDRGMIFPDNEGKLNPMKLLDRDEFVGISMEVTCKKCIQPNVDLEYIERYTGNQKYFDVDERNKYYYCISEADSLEQVKGYDVGQKCENGTYKEGERAFCPLNTITREEAYAVILRNSGLWTIEQNKDLLDRIVSGENFETLSDDVGPKNIDGSPYTFYGYLNKALEFQLLEYDSKGNSIITPLLQKQDNKIYPKKALTKEEFIIMAYIALRNNNCAMKDVQDDIALSLDIKDVSCSESKKNCKNVLLDSKKPVYDFSSEIQSQCDGGIKSHIWRFYNTNTGEKIIKYDRYIDNFTFTSFGTWQIYFRAIDNCGNTSEVHSTISYQGNMYLNIDIFEKECNASKVGMCKEIGTEGKIGENTYDFNGNLIGGAGGEIYTWTFTHRETGEIITKTGKYIDNLEFPKDGVWDIDLQVKNIDGTIINSVTLITVSSSLTEDAQKSGDIDIFEKECNASKVGICKEIGTEGKIGENTYDFNGNLIGGIGGEIYTWTFTHREAGEIITKTGKYIDNLEFPKNGVWDIKLDIIGPNSEKITIDSLINIKLSSDVSVMIEANPISGNGPLQVDFDSIIGGIPSVKEYIWDFGDGEDDVGKTTSHIYDEAGSYEVKLTVIDESGDYYTATINILVDSVDCSVDIDNDGTLDCEDKCIGVKGDKLNLGCPILEKKCNLDCSCSDGYTCSTGDIKVCSTEGICEVDKKNISGINSNLGTSPGITPTSGASGKQTYTLSDNCLYDSGKDTIYGNVVCNSCPCSLSIDYMASIRKCDVLFPAITSPDSKEIYSKGKMYLVK